MHADFWHQRWADGKTGFHRDEVNPFLEAHFEVLGADKDSRVFVPLCGKSVDVDWLAGRVGRVVANELSQQAVTEFFTISGREPFQQTSGLLEWWRADNIEIACGDFFQLRREELSGVDMVYDRASLIALPQDMRADYAAHMQSLLEPGSRILLVTLEYDQSKLDGPPFSVSEEELQELFGKNFDIELLETRDALEDKFRERGLSRLEEKAYILQHRDNA